MACLVVGVVVAWIAGRTVFAFKSDDPRIRTYLIGATAIAAFAIVFALLRLLFAPTGYFSSVTGVKADGTPDSFLGGANLTSLALADPAGLIGALVVALIVGFLVWTWARRGENARLFPVWVGGATTGLVAAAISAPIAAGVFGGVTGGGTDALVALFRTLGLGRLPVGVRPGPDQRPARQDDQLHDRLRHPRRPADHRPDDVQPRRVDGRGATCRTRAVTPRSAKSEGCRRPPAISSRVRAGSTGATR